MKHVVIVSMEIPDETPSSVAEDVVSGFRQVNEELAAQYRDHYADFFEIRVRTGGVKDGTAFLIEPADQG
jgi:hypothetical protein